MENADGVYARQHPWELTSQTLEMQRREWADDAQSWYAPVVPQPDAHDMVPPMYGYRTTELGIDDILNDVYSRLDGSRAADAMPTDFTGERGGYTASSRFVEGGRGTP